MRTAPTSLPVHAFPACRRLLWLVPILTVASTLSVHATIYTWSGGTTGTWTNGASWGGTAPGSGDDATFAGSTAQTASFNGTTASVGTLTITNTGSTTIQGGTAAGTLGIGAGGISMSSTAGTLTMGGTGITALNIDLTATAESWTNSSTSHVLVIDNGITSTAGAPTTLTFNGTGTTTIIGTGPVTDGTGAPLSIAVTSGALTIGNSSVAYIYSGGTSISGGTLNINTTNALGNGTLTISGGTVNNSAGGIVILPNAVNINGSFVTLNSGAHSMTFNGVTTIANTDTLTVNSFDLQFQNNINFANSTSTLAVGGTGAVLLFGSSGSSSAGIGSANGTNTWTGVSTNTLTILSGTSLAVRFNLANGTSVGSNIVNNDTATFSLEGAENTGVTNIFSGNISGAGDFQQENSGESIFTGTNTYQGGTAISTGTIQFAKTYSMPGTGTVTVSNGATLGINAGGTNEWTSGASGAGTVAGIFANTGGSGGGVTLNSGATVNIDTTNATAVVTDSGNIAAGTNTLTIAKLGTGTLNISGNISGVANVNQLGAGELILSGTNTYAGATTFSNGTLQYTGTSSASGSSTLAIIGTGETLGLNLLSDTTGTFSTAGITLSGSNGTLNIDVDPQTSASGQTLTLAGTITTASNVTGNVINVTSANGYNLGLGAISITSGTNNIPADHTVQLNAASGLNVSTGLVTYGSYGGELILGGTGTITIAQLDYNSNGNGATVIGDGTSGNSPTVTFTSGATSSNSRGSGTAAYTLNSGVFNITNTGIFANPGGSAATLTINGGEIENTSGTAVVSANSTGAITLGGNFSFGNSTDTGTGSVTIGLSASTGYIREAASDVTVTLNGGGGLTLIGPLTSTIGTNTLTVNNGSGTGATTAFTISGLNLSDSSSSGTQTINGTGNVVVTGSITNGSASAGAGAGNFTTAAAGNLTYAGTGTLTLGGTSSFTGGLNVNSGTVAASAGTAALGASSNAINVNGGTLSIGAFNETTGTVTLTSGTIASTTGTLTGSAYAMQNGTVSALLGGAGGLTKTTTGTVVLSGLNSYSGGTTITAGTIQVGTGPGGGANDALGNTSGALTIAGTGTLDLNGHQVQTGFMTGSGTVLNNAVGTGTLVFNTSASATGTFSGVIENGTGTVTIQKDGGDLEVFNGVNTYTGATTITTGTLQIGDGSNGSLASTTAISVTNAGSAIAFNEANGSTISNSISTSGTGALVIGAEATGTNTLSGVISGSGGFLQSGAGATVMTNVNTFTGTTTISAGLLQLGNGGTSGKLATTGMIVDNGTLVIDRSNAMIQGTGFSTAAISGTGALVQIGTGTTTLTAANTYTGTTTISAGALQLGSGSTTGGLSAGSAIVDNGSFIVDRSNAVSQGTDFSSAAITGSGGLSQIGTGTTTLTAANSFTGTTTISSGAIQLGNGGTTGGLSASSAIVDNGTLIVDRSNGVSQGTDFSSAAITGSGGFTQAGSGTTTLSASNGYTGTTTINAGALSITGSTYSSGAVIINTGGTLKGTGTTGLVTLSSGGSINLADGVIGTLTIGSLTTTGGGSLTFEIGTGGTTQIDKIADSGSLSASGSTVIDVANLGGVGQTLTTGTYTILAYTGTQQSLGDFSLSTTSLDGKSLSLAQSGDNIEIVVNSTTATTYTLSTSAGSTLLHSGATTTLTTTITNTGTGIADSLNYSGLGATAATGTVTGSLASGGPVANTGGTAVTTQTYTATTAGSDAISATGTATNATIGGGASQTSSTGTTINVYSGVGEWKTNGGGSWGAVAATPANWTANGGTPGVTAGFTNTDSASFGSVLASGTGSVTLDGANPSLNAITFDDSAASYVIAQGTGTGSITLDGNGGNANVTDVAGTHEISAPINLATSANVDVASGQQLTMSGTISGTGGLVNNGSGTTILSGNNGYSGGTTVSSGILQLSNSGGSATGSGALNVGAGATLAGSGSSNGSSFSVTGNSSTRAMVLVGHNTASDLNTTGVMSLSGSGASSIGSANLAFNLNANVAGQGNQLSVGATNIAFNTVGSMNTTLTLNLQGSNIIAAGTDYILVAGTTASGGTGQLDSQYTGLDLGTSVSLGSGITETQILNSNYGGTGSVNLSFGSANSYYGANSTLFLYQNTNTGQDDIEVEVVPEPGTWAMMLGGLAMLVFWQRRKNRS